MKYVPKSPSELNAMTLGDLQEHQVLISQAQSKLILGSEWRYALVMSALLLITWTLGRLSDVPGETIAVIVLPLAVFASWAYIRIEWHELELKMVEVRIEMLNRRVRSLEST